MGSLFATTSGIPFSFPIDGNKLTAYGNYASGVTCIGDILAEKGYNQEFICGSDGSFAGRKQYFEQHGNYKFFDYYTAIEEGYIASDYYVWWGFEDAILFDIAKDEATRLAQDGRPFNLTLLTADTHFPDGYICSHCGSQYASVAENVIACSDTLVTQFVEWCTQQDFYEDTVIVLTGDHPRMDNDLVEDLEYKDRPVYNCFINASRTAHNTKNRIFTPMDMFPTVLSAMGYEIDGERLGLGTNLFSDTPTLAEQLGFDTLNSELDKYSLYYVENFY